MLVIYAALSLLFTFVFSASVPKAPKRQALPQVITKCTVPNTVALTFDDGPYTYIKDISQSLINAGAKGTFFFNGNNWRCIYTPESVDRVKYIYDQGHQIASHTWAHKNLTTLTYDQLHSQFWRVEQAFKRIIGVTPAFLRPPYGAYNDLVRRVALERNQKVVNWDFDSRDAMGATAAESKQLYQDAAAMHPPNILAINHEVFEPTAHDVIPYAISLLTSQGYKLVTVAQCLGLKPYTTIGKPENGSWTC